MKIDKVEFKPSDTMLQALEKLRDAINAIIDYLGTDNK